jgi:hypothetical protein
MRTPADLKNEDIAKQACDLAALFVQEGRQRVNMGS